MLDRICMSRLMCIAGAVLSNTVNWLLVVAVSAHQFTVLITAPFLQAMEKPAGMLLLPAPEVLSSAMTGSMIAHLPLEWHSSKLDAPQMAAACSCTQYTQSCCCAAMHSMDTNGKIAMTIADDRNSGH